MPDKTKLQELILEVVHNLKGSKEVQSHIIKVETGFEADDLMSLGSVAMDTLLEQACPWLTEEERLEILPVVQAAFVAGTLVHAKSKKGKS